MFIVAIIVVVIIFGVVYDIWDKAKKKEEKERRQREVDAKRYREEREKSYQKEQLHKKEEQLNLRASVYGKTLGGHPMIRDLSEKISRSWEGYIRSTIVDFDRNSDALTMVVRVQVSPYDANGYRFQDYNVSALKEDPEREIKQRGIAWILMEQITPVMLERFSRYLMQVKRKSISYDSQTQKAVAVVEFSAKVSYYETI